MPRARATPEPDISALAVSLALTLCHCAQLFAEDRPATTALDILQALEFTRHTFTEKLLAHEDNRGKR